MFRRLDGLTDEQCIVIFARHDKARSLAALSAGLVGMVAGALLAFPTAMWTLGSDGIAGDMETVLGRAIFAAACTVTLSITLYLMGLTYYAILGSALHRSIERASCPQCESPLFGLPITEDRIICPTCSQVLLLGANRLRPEDFQLPAPTQLPSYLREPTPSTALNRLTLIAFAFLPLSAIMWILTGSGWSCLGLGPAAYLGIHFAREARRCMYARILSRS